MELNIRANGKKDAKSSRGSHKKSKSMLESVSSSALKKKKKKKLMDSVDEKSDYSSLLGGRSKNLRKEDYGTQETIEDDISDNRSRKRSRSRNKSKSSGGKSHSSNSNVVKSSEIRKAQRLIDQITKLWARKESSEHTYSSQSQQNSKLKNTDHQQGISKIVMDLIIRYNLLFKFFEDNENHVDIIEY